MIFVDYKGARKIDSLMTPHKLRQLTKKTQSKSNQSSYKLFKRSQIIYKPLYWDVKVYQKIRKRKGPKLNLCGTPGFTYISLRWKLLHVDDN